MTEITAQDINQFWFSEIEQKLWFKKDDAFDQLLIERFGPLQKSAAQAELYQWRSTPEGRLAEIIVLDQFSRNMFRDSPLAFACDPLALALAQVAIACGDDQKLSPEHRTFLYMPFMHSESLPIHDVALQLFADLGRESNLDFEKKHRVIIEEFGRYPHRNKVLGRESTALEIEFLAKPGSSF